MHKEARPKFPYQLVLGLAAVEEIISSGDFRSLFYLYAEVRAAYATHPVTVYGKDLTEMINWARKEVYMKYRARFEETEIKVKGQLFINPSNKRIELMDVETLTFPKPLPWVLNIITVQLSNCLAALGLTDWQVVKARD